VLNSEENAKEPGGRERIFRISLISLNNSNKNVICIIGIYKDITNREMTEMNKEKLYPKLKEK
jgi:hypothetical protein